MNEQQQNKMIEDFVQFNVRNAKKEFESGKPLSIVAFVGTYNDEPVYIPIFGMNELLETPATKRQFKPVLEGLYLRAVKDKSLTKLFAVIFINDVFISAQKQVPGQRLIRPELDPMRSEGMMVQVSYPDKTVLTTWIYKRVDGKIIFEEKPRDPDVDFSKGMLANLFPEAAK